MNKINAILDFWFEGLTDASILKNNPTVVRWFRKDAKFDEAIRTRFEDDLIKAARGEYSDWANNREGSRALIILFDQFSRNLYRNSPKAFENDAKALSLTQEAIKKGFDKDLDLIKRIFLYMPLMHAEDKDIQKQSVQMFSSLVEEAKKKTPHNASYYENSLKYAKEHQEIVDRFGRFPHRNSILNRTSTPEETQFLTRHSGF